MFNGGGIEGDQNAETIPRLYNNILTMIILTEIIFAKKITGKCDIFWK